MSNVYNLKKTYYHFGAPDFVLDIEHLALSDEGVTVLLGPSGAGKTSIFRILVGLESCPGLQWNFSGEDLATFSVRERRLGVVFQDYSLFPHLTAEANILFAGQARGRAPQAMRVDLDDLVEKLQLQAVLKRPARLLSGGEQQRVALARALMGQPRMLLLDEPFSALNQELRESARLLVAKTLRHTGIPALMITHDPQDVHAFSPQIVRLENGRLLS